MARVNAVQVVAGAQGTGNAWPRASSPHLSSRPPSLGIRSGRPRTPQAGRARRSRSPRTRGSSARSSSPGCVTSPTATGRRDDRNCRHTSGRSRSPPDGAGPRLAAAAACALLACLRRVSGQLVLHRFDEFPEQPGRFGVEGGTARRRTWTARRAGEVFVGRIGSSGAAERIISHGNKPCPKAPAALSDGVTLLT